MQRYLCVDVGGTNTTIGLMEVKDDGVIDSVTSYSLLEHRAYNSRELEGILPALEDGLHYFKHTYSLKVTPRINISVCGPTDGDTCQPSNLPAPLWYIDRKKLEMHFQTDIYLMNDFAAVSYGLMTISDSEDEKIVHISGSPKADFSTKNESIKLALGAGTGLGCATLYKKYPLVSLIPSEAGWLDFSPDIHSELELRYFRYLACYDVNTHTQLDFKEPQYSWEDAISASRGINNIVYFFLDSNYSYDALTSEERIELNHKIKSLEQCDLAPTISELAKQSHSAALKILKFWIKLYARYARNIALTSIPKGGLFLGGGAAAKNIEYFFKQNIFLEEFRHHPIPIISDLLNTIPLYIITEYRISLYGNAYHIHNKNTVQSL